MRKTTRRRGARKGKPRGTKGRNPTGLQPGERLSDYPRLTVRVPQETVDRVRELAEREGVPQWRILHAAIQAYAASRIS
jgi:Ribbon-helix-helix protein, copG family